MSKKLNNVLAKTLSSVSSSLQGKKKQKSKSKRSMRSRKNAQIRQGNGILAGYGSPLTAIFNSRMTDDGAVVTGLDLLPDPGMKGLVSFFCSANPADWTGTRISAIARGFQNYRPNKFVIHYRPKVGSIISGEVYIGTIWQGNTINDELGVYPSLLTSPGGAYLPPWQSSRSIVPCGACLPQRMYPIRDPSRDVTPFSIVCCCKNDSDESGFGGMLGKIFVEYEYEFHNAVGSLGTYLPPSFEYIAVSETTLYVGDKSIGDFWIVDDENVDAIQGVVVDTSLQSDVPDKLARFPINSHITTDFLVATRQGAATATRIALIKINGEYPLPYTGAFVTGGLTIYAGFGRTPPNPVNPPALLSTPPYRTPNLRTDATSSSSSHSAGGGAASAVPPPPGGVRAVRQALSH